MKLKSLKLHDIFLHYFFHPGAIPCRCSPAAPGDLSSRPRPFPLRHFAFSSLQESGSRPLSSGMLLQGANGKGTFPKYTEIETTRSLLRSEEEEGSQ